MATQVKQVPQNIRRATDQEMKVGAQVIVSTCNGLSRVPEFWGKVTYNERKSPYIAVDGCQYRKYEIFVPQEEAPKPVTVIEERSKFHNGSWEALPTVTLTEDATTVQGLKVVQDRVTKRKEQGFDMREDVGYKDALSALSGTDGRGHRSVIKFLSQ